MLFRRPFVLAFFITCAVLFGLTACDLGLNQAVTPTTTAEANIAAPDGTAAAPPGAEGTPVALQATPTPSVPQGGMLTVRLAEPIERLTPWDIKSRGEEQAVQLLYNGLMRLNAERQPEVDLAERYEVAPGGGVLTFTLRSGVRWHDDQPLTGEDVAWTLNTMRTLTPTNALLYDLRSNIAEIRTPISGTVVVSLTKAYAPILANLTVPILPRHALQGQTLEQLANLDFAREPVGSGPFIWETLNEEGQTLTRNSNYFRGSPNLERVRLMLMPSNEEAQAALSEGTLLAAEFPTTTNALTLTGPLRAGVYLENGSYWLAFNVREGRLFSDPVVREALAQAVDVPALVRQVTGERGEPLVTSILPDSWAEPGLQPSPINLDQARQQLETAGYALAPDAQIRSKNGEPLQARLYVRADDAVRVAAANAIAEVAATVGIGLEVVAIPFEPDFVSKLAPPYDWDLLLGSWVNAPNTTGFATNRFYDPDDSPLFASDQIYRGEGDARVGLRNIGGYSSTAYDQAALEALATYDPAARQAAIAAAQQVIRRDLPYLFLWTNRVPVVLSARLKQTSGEIPLNTPHYLNSIEQWYLAP